MNNTIYEPARELPVLGDYDVVVCGGGPAGCAAAIGAARHGARTLLLEKEGFLGGAAVSQLVCVVLSTNGVDFQGVSHGSADVKNPGEATMSGLNVELCPETGICSID